MWVGKIGSPGYWCTRNAARGQDCPWIENPTVDELSAWVASNRIHILNVAGNRESKNPGVYEQTKQLIVMAFSA